MKIGTTCVHAGHEPDHATGAVNVPIYATSTYAYRRFGEALRLGRRADDPKPIPQLDADTYSRRLLGALEDLDAFGGQDLLHQLVLPVPPPADRVLAIGRPPSGHNHAGPG